jgi:hypothetical protein
MTLHSPATNEPSTSKPLATWLPPAAAFLLASGEALLLGWGIVVALGPASSEVTLVTLESEDKIEVAAALKLLKGKSVAIGPGGL